MEHLASRSILLLVATAFLAGPVVASAKEIRRDANGHPCPEAKTQVDPRYPRKAIDQKIPKGFVALAFDLRQGEGHPQNIRVLSSSPAGMFDRTTVKGFEQWVFVAERDLVNCTFEVEYKLRDDRRN